ncbi:MAG: sugar-binding domain-containing protein [Ostreibacterium sp.]
MSIEERMARIAWFYYHDNLTQTEISHLLGIPRLKVSRLLEKGKQQGIIHVQVHSRFENCFVLEEKIKQQFGLSEVRIIPDSDPINSDMNMRVSIGATDLLMKKLKAGDLLAIGFGKTMMMMLKNLSSFLQTRKIPVVSLAGGVGSYMEGISHLGADCDISLVPSPLRVSSKEVANALYQEASINDVLLTSCSASVAAISIGSIEQKEKATMCQAGYISFSEQKILQRKGAVGDILGYFFGEDGHILDNIRLHEELIAIRPEKLRNIPLVIGVADGQVKARAVLAALRGKYINSLVANEATAEKLISLIS